MLVFHIVLLVPVRADLLLTSPANKPRKMAPVLGLLSLKWETKIKFLALASGFSISQITGSIVYSQQLKDSFDSLYLK